MAFRAQVSRRTVVALSTWVAFVGITGAVAALAAADRSAAPELELVTVDGTARLTDLAGSAVIVEIAAATTTTSPPTTLPPAPPTTTAPTVPETTVRSAPPPTTTPPTAPPPTSPPPPPPPTPAEVDAAAEQQLLADHNSRRAAQGLSPLLRDPCLDAIARDWSAQMVAEDNLRHNPGFAAAVDRCISWTGVAENVGYAMTAESLAALFWESAGHRANILGPYQYVGVGIVVGPDGRRWATLEFANG